MDETRRISAGWYGWMLVIFAAVVCFGALGVRELASGDETRVAGIGAEMAVTGDFVVPRLNGQPFLEYPPAYYWLEAVAFQCFGFTDWAAKLPSALAGWLGALVLFLLGRKLHFGTLASFLGGVMLVTGAQYFANARTCMVDMLLAFFILLAVYAFAAMLHARRGWRKWAWWGLCGAAMGGGIFTKGLIGMALPVAALGMFLLLDDWRHRRICLIRYVALAGGVVLALVPTAWWLYELNLRAGAEAVYEVVVTNNFGRFSGSQGDHVEGWYYYLLKLPQQFQPWLILLPGGIWLLWRRGWERKRSGALLILCFLLVPYLLLTMSSSKRQVYLLPLYAPAALAAGAFVVWSWGRLASALRDGAKRYWRIPVAVLVLAALVFVILAPGWFRLWPLAALAALLAAMWLGAGRRCAALLLLGFGLFYASIDAAVLARRNDDESLRKLFLYCESSGVPVVLVNPSERIRGAAYFYLRRSVPERKLEECDGIAEELWILRNKKATDGMPFADSHQLYRVPGELPAAFKRL